jgi:inorganic phosphate transporter, PiT family
MGPITNLGLSISTLWISVLGGFAMASGTLTFGHRVTQTVGGGITQLDPTSAYSAQMAAALAVHFFSLYGIPVSTSQAVVGAIIGVGILQGVKTVRAKKLAGIAAGWVATPTAAGLFSFVLYRLVLAVTG